MNDKKGNIKKNKSNNFLKENGFIVALYSVVGVLVVVAVSMTFFMPSAPMDEAIVSLEGSKNVSNNFDKSYTLGFEDTESMQNETEEEAESIKNEEDSNKEEVKAEQSNDNNDVNKELEEDDTSSITSGNVLYEDDYTLATAQPVMSFEETEENEETQDNTSDEEVTETNNDDDEDDTQRNEDVTMIWPTNGEILLGYSPEVLVYDATLDQYRTNDSIDIASNKGADVFASYDGVVKMVSHSVDQGNYVVIDHGNGWVTTYGQLDDHMKVSVGDEIKKGQQIGTIAEPTSNSVLLGSHLDFKVTKNDETVNPLDILE